MMPTSIQHTRRQTMMTHGGPDYRSEGIANAPNSKRSTTRHEPNMALLWRDPTLLLSTYPAKVYPETPPCQTTPKEFVPGVRNARLSESEGPASRQDARCASSRDTLSSWSETSDYGPSSRRKAGFPRTGERRQRAQYQRGATACESRVTSHGSRLTSDVRAHSPAWSVISTSPWRSSRRIVSLIVSPIS